jgi:CRP-like cAMP-binding protein
MSISVDELVRVPLFQGMTDRALDSLAELAGEVSFPAGAAMAAEGEEGGAFYLLVTGRARVTRDGNEIRDLGPGDFFGEISLVDGRPRTASVTATSDVAAVEIRRDEFLRVMDRFPAVRLSILMALADRIRADDQADA